MSSNLYLFDPSTYDAKSVDKPLVQIMREAERARSHESSRLIGHAVRSLVGLFRTKREAAPAAPAEFRKAA